MKEAIKFLLNDFKTTVSIPVQWGDMDAAQHVNNVVYMRWAETARITYLNQLDDGLDPVGKEVGVILGYQDCKYIFPVTFPDTIWVGIKVVELKKDRFLFLSHFVSERHQRLVAIAHQTVVTYNYIALQKIDLPETMRLAIEQLEGIAI